MESSRSAITLSAQPSPGRAVIARALLSAPLLGLLLLRPART